MKKLTLFLLLILTISTLEALADQSPTVPVRPALMAGTIVNAQPDGVGRGGYGQSFQSTGPVAPSGRSNAELMRALYPERNEEPFWKR